MEAQKLKFHLHKYMAKRNNVSFFGKLVGNSGPASDDMESDDETLTPSQSQHNDDGELLLEDQDVELEVVQSEDPTPVAVSRAAASMVTAQTQGNGEEWMADFEGQLNIDMYQTKDNVVIQSTVAGVKAEGLDITVANDVVTIRGSRKREDGIASEDYFYQECYWGSFSRSVIVPVDIDSEHIEADLKEGILTIVISKAAKAKTKKVKVRGL